MEHPRLYRHFSKLEDSQALLGLLRMHAIDFETTFRKQTDYYKISTESTRLEVWVRGIDYEIVQQLEATLTAEEAAELAHNYFFIIASDEELLGIARQQQFPEDAAVAQRILLSRKPYESAVLSPA